MKSSKQKSGNEKKIAKRRTELTLASSDPKQLKLSFSTTSTSDQTTLTVTKDNVELEEESEIAEDNNLNCEDGESHHEVSKPIFYDTCECEESSAGHEQSIQETEPSQAKAVVSDSTAAEVAENDPVVFLKMENPSIQDKKRFILLGPCQPNLPLAHSSAKIIKYFMEERKVGNVTVRQKRSWLTYSPYMDKLFCNTCLVFGKRDDTNVLRDGFNQWNNLSHRVAQHCSQKNHRVACETLTAVMCDQTIDTQLCKEAKELLDKRKLHALELRQYLYRIIDVLRYLTAETIPRRGSDESEFHNRTAESVCYQQGAGNFLNLLNILAQYDILLAKKLSEIKQSSCDKKGRGSRLTFLSNNTQDKLTAVMAGLVRDKIKQEIDRALFFSVAVDGTTDITLCEQEAIVVRYVKSDSTEVEVCERLLSLVECETTTGEEITRTIKSAFDSLNLEKCVGMSFDGASNMQGRGKGVVTRMKEYAPMSIGVYCGAHGSNLVMKYCCRSSVQAVNIYGTDNKPGMLQKLRTFLYGNARKRNQVFNEFKRQSDEELHQLELAETHSIRFSSVHDATKRVIQLYPIVLSTLDSICHNNEDFDAAVRAEANGLNLFLLSFESLLTLMLYLHIFEILNPLSKILQNKGIDYMVAMTAVDVCQQKLQDMRDTTGESIVAAAEEMAIKVNITPVLKTTRHRKKRILDGEEAADEGTRPGIQGWVAEVLFTAIDAASTVLEDKFSSQRALLQSLSSFIPSTFRTMVRDKFCSLDITAIAANFNLEECSLKEELTDFVTICCKYNAEMLNKEHSSFIAVHTFIKEKQLASVFPLLSVLYQILATIPVNSAECERIFSKMKLIKTRLANRLTSEHLADRLLLAAETDMMWSLEREDIIKAYADTDELKRVLYP